MACRFDAPAGFSRANNAGRLGPEPSGTGGAVADFYDAAMPPTLGRLRGGLGPVWAATARIKLLNGDVGEGRHHRVNLILLWAVNSAT